MKRKQLLTTILEIVSAAAIVAGVALIWVPAAFIVGGALGIVFSFAVIGGRR